MQEHENNFIGQIMPFKKNYFPYSRDVWQDCHNYIQVDNNNNTSSNFQT